MKKGTKREREVGAEVFNRGRKPNEVFNVALSPRDRAPELQLSKDQLSVWNSMGGYRMIRATHGVHHGSYFYEVEIHEPKSTNAHVRLGWSARLGSLQGPCGFDKWGYGYRDIAGSKVHNGVRDDKYGSPYGPGDIIGCFLHLDDQEPGNNQMRFFKNGIDQGIAFQGKEIESGIYFPAISLYMQASVTVNFGPSFILRHDIYGANAISELQPLSPDDRKLHEKRIFAARAARGASEDTKGLLLMPGNALITIPNA